MRVEASTQYGVGSMESGGSAPSGYSRLRKQDVLAQSADLARDGGTGETALHRAARHGNASELRRLLKVGADAQVMDYGGVMPLHRAAEAGSVDAISALKRRGVAVDREDRLGRTPLAAVASAGVGAVVARSLLLARANPDGGEHGAEPPLITVCRQGDTVAVQHLLHARASPNTQAPSGSSSGGPASALQIAAAAGNVDLLLVLLQARASPNLVPPWPESKNCGTCPRAATGSVGTDYSGRPPLLLAAERGHLRVVQALLHAAAAPNAVADVHGNSTALVAAGRGGHTEVIHELLRNNAEPCDGVVAAGLFRIRGRSCGRARPGGLAHCLRSPKPYVVPSPTCAAPLDREASHIL